MRACLFILVFLIASSVHAQQQQFPMGNWQRSYDGLHVVDITTPIVDSVRENIFTEIDSARGRAIYSTSPGCDRWLKFTVPADTLLRFTITPFDGKTDLDFILIKYDGSNFIEDFKNDRIQHSRACLSAPVADVTTGCSYRATAVTVQPGPGVAHVRPVDAKKGETYYLFVQFGLVQNVPGYDHPPRDKRFRICFFDDCEPKKITMRNLHFDTGKSTLRPESDKTLDSMYVLLKGMNYPQIKIVGHTDDIGSDSSNMRLSRDRAKTVYDYFISKGYPSGNMSYAGMGSHNPVAFNDTETGRQLNRRVEIQFVK